MARHTDRTAEFQRGLGRSSEPNPCAWSRCKSDADAELGIPICKAHLREAWAIHQVMLNDGTAGQRPSPEHVPSPHAKEAVGWVYFAQVGPHIKIGWTTNLRRRMTQLGGATMATIPNKTREDERKMQLTFEACRDKSMGREYFHPAPALTRYVKDLQTGKPRSQ